MSDYEVYISPQATKELKELPANFRHLFVSRLPDVDTENEEGVVIHLSAIKRYLNQNRIAKFRTQLHPFSILSCSRF